MGPLAGGGGLPIRHGRAMVVCNGREAAVGLERRSAGVDWRKCIVCVRNSVEGGSAEGLREGRKRLRWLGRHDIAARWEEGRGGKRLGGEDGGGGRSSQCMRWERMAGGEEEEEVEMREAGDDEARRTTTLAKHSWPPNQTVLPIGRPCSRLLRSTYLYSRPPPSSPSPISTKKCVLCSSRLSPLIFLTNLTYFVDGL